MARRQYKSGSVYQRASDGRWIGTLEAGETLDGKRRRVTVSALTEAACKRAVDEKSRELAKNGIPLAGVESRMTVARWSEIWLARNALEVRPKSFVTDQSAVTKWINPLIGKRRLDKLTPGDVVAVVDAIANARSMSTANRYHATLRKMLKDAIAIGHEVPPRALMANVPKRNENDRGDIPLAHAHALLRAAASDPHSATRWAAGFLQGMRQGECLGLTWSAVDLERYTIDVSWQLQAMPYEHGCADKPCGRRYGGDCPHRKFRLPRAYTARRLEGSLHLVRPKTAQGRRIIPMIPWMTESLRAWKADAPANPHNLVWANPDGTPRTGPQDRAQWIELQTAADVRRALDDGNTRAYDIHEMRHTTATLLLEAGVDPEVIKAILGHADIKTSRGYMHVSELLARKALEDVGRKLQLG